MTTLCADDVLCVAMVGKKVLIRLKLARHKKVPRESDKRTHDTGRGRVV